MKERRAKAAKDAREAARREKEVRERQEMEARRRREVEAKQHELQLKMAQTEAEADRFQALGASRSQLVVNGSVKFDLTLDHAVRDRAAAKKETSRAERQEAALVVAEESRLQRESRAMVKAAREKHLKRRNTRLFEGFMRGPRFVGGS